MNNLIPFILSIFIPGGGQILLKDYPKGIIMIALAFGPGFLIPFFPIYYLYVGVMIWSLIDVYVKMEKISGKSKAIRYLIISIVIVIVLIPAVFHLSALSLTIGGDYLANKVTNARNTEKEMKEISVELDRYYDKHLRYPEDFQKFVQSKPIWTHWGRDHWKNRYRYNQPDSVSYILISAGEDQSFYTDDDIVMRSDG